MARVGRTAGERGGLGEFEAGWDGGPVRVVRSRWGWGGGAEPGGQEQVGAGLCGRAGVRNVWACV